MCGIQIEQLPFFPESNAIGKLKASRPAHTLAADFFGPFRVRQRGGANLACLIVDEHSGLMFLFLFEKKSDFLQAFKNFVALIEADKGTGPTVARLTQTVQKRFCNMLWSTFVPREE